MAEMNKGYTEERTRTRVYEPSGNGHAEHYSEPARTETHDTAPTAGAERALGSASGVEVAAGAGVVALAIIALAGAVPQILLSICSIVAGGALLLAGSAQGVRAKATHGATRKELFAGVSAETFGGVGAVVLGILALIGFASLTLNSIVVIALGGALLFSTMVPAKEEELGSPRVEKTGEGAAAVQGLVGVGAVALGILALIGISSLTLCLVAFLGIGASEMMTGSTLMAGAALEHAHAH